MEKTTTLWSTLPGWGIAADLIPPELVNARQLTFLRKLMAAALAVLLVLCAAGYYLARRQNSAASAANATVSAQTTKLQNEAKSKQYRDVTKMQSTVTQVDSQIATLMAGDVDVVELLQHLRTSLPSSMKINQESITITPAAIAGGAGSGLDTSGLARIGTVSLGGSGVALTDLSAYVLRLGAIPGLVDVIPVSNTMSKDGTQFSLTMGLTTAALSHRYDISKKATR